MSDDTLRAAARTLMLERERLSDEAHEHLRKVRAIDQALGVDPANAATKPLPARAARPASRAGKALGYRAEVDYRTNLELLVTVMGSHERLWKTEEVRAAFGREGRHVSYEIMAGILSKGVARGVIKRVARGVYRTPCPDHEQEQEPTTSWNGHERGPHITDAPNVAPTPREAHELMRPTPPHLMTIGIGDGEPHITGEFGQKLRATDPPPDEVDQDDDEE